MSNLFQGLAKLSPAALSAIVALAGATGAIISALITVLIGKFIVTPFLSARDKQDKEAEWRKHAIELTKLAVDAKLKIRQPTDTEPIRPPILDFLANYRDLQELGSKSPKELYMAIRSGRITKPDAPNLVDSSAPLPNLTTLPIGSRDNPVLNQPTQSLIAVGIGICLLGLLARFVRRTS